MRNLKRLTYAANRLQATTDFVRLRAIAVEFDCADAIGLFPLGAGARKVDKVAKESVERILQRKPEAREKLSELYPGFVR